MTTSKERDTSNETVEVLLKNHEGLLKINETLLKINEILLKQNETLPTPSGSLLKYSGDLPAVTEFLLKSRIVLRDDIDGLSKIADHIRLNKEPLLILQKLPTKYLDSHELLLSMINDHQDNLQKFQDIIHKRQTIIRNVLELI